MDDFNATTTFSDPIFIPIVSQMMDINGRLTIDRSGIDFNQNINYRNPNWMSFIDNSTRISELSIPGTHGSMARYAPLGLSELVINQTMPLITQLNAGIRYLDIRCRHYHNQFAIHHGLVWQNTFFGNDVLLVIINFLRQNPTETILMRVQEEYNPVGNSRSFGETFEAYWIPNQTFFWNPTNSNPTLGEVRGRIILLQQFSGPNNRMFGINYGSLRIQDQWNVVRPGYDKWISIRNHFTTAMNNRNQIHLNHLSGHGGAGGPMPWFLASGYNNRNNNSNIREIGGTTSSWPDFPRSQPPSSSQRHVFQGGMNLLSTRRIRDGRVNHTGIIAADFPGAGLIRFTIELNGRHIQRNSIHHFLINSQGLIEVSFLGNLYLSNRYRIQRNQFTIMEINNGNATSPTGSVSSIPTNLGRTFIYDRNSFHNDELTLWVFLNGQWIVLRRFFADIDENNSQTIVVDNGIYHIVTALNNTSLVDMNLSSYLTYNVHLWGNVNQVNAQWQIQRLSPHFSDVSIRNELNAHRNHFLRRYYFSNNVNAVPSSVSVPASGFWNITRAGNGFVTIGADGAWEQILDVTGSNTRNGTNIITYRRTNNNNQRFRLRRIR